MSMYGDSPYNEERNILYNEMKLFLEIHPISELLGIVSDVVESKELAESEDKE